MKTAPLLVVLAAAILTGCGAARPRGAAGECAGCHAKRTLGAEWALSNVHEPFRDEAGCDACHGRHGEQPRNVLVEEQPGLCLKCHEGEAFQRGRMHSAVAMAGCSGCHRPHASAVPQLLLAPKEALCGKCHTDLSKTHGGYLVDPGRCGSCHDAHSASNEKLLHRVSHEVLSDCSSCHAPPGSKRPFALSKPQPDLCWDCHSELKEKLGKRKVVHAPVAKGACTGCHAPHAVDEPALLARPRAALCGTCHAAIAGKGKGATGHAPVQAGR